MSEGERYALIGAMVGAIGSGAFPARLAALLQSVARYNFTVIFGYRGDAPPMDLYDDFPSGKRKVFVTDYQAGPYLLDPFYLASVQPVRPDLYRLSDLAPDRFYQGEYFRSYYARTGLAEEIGFFIDLPGPAMAVVSMMRSEKVFSAREFRQLQELYPIVAAAGRLHWKDLAATFTTPADQDTVHGMTDRIQTSFQTFGDGILTPREREIVEFTLKGHSAEAIGRILGITPGTVRIHRRNVYSKLRISSQGELFSTFIGALGRG